ncbi:ABC transporter permease [Methylobacterium gossipiicola]|uniref:Osmoprotectant transport system permease protein n=1 Tax=Methylobacterium gossipiicola TaxID=582675 RepID=A0A1I2U0Q5_9HYPH|nr:ABC transporter permease subunit [Methylobacterium gossipiicola]SFG70730.1 osmoprotectant transport system permease protein [Methylobacterium gossipiicola]
MSGRPLVSVAATGLVLAAMSHPAVATRIAGALGEAPRRALDVDRLLALAGQHLVLAGTGFALVAILGIGLGILATREGAAPLRPALDALAAGAQAVPPVVTVALALPILGFGGPPTLLALVAYGVMPLLRGTAGALAAVPPDAKAAAEAMGLTRRQILARVELPLAAPEVVESLRTALVLAVATAAVGALAGANTLGTPIVAGLQNQNIVPMLQGTTATAALAFLGDAALVGLAGLFRINPPRT